MKGFTPIYSLSVGGQDITSTVSPFLVTLSVSDALKADSDELSITLDWRARKIALPRRGAALTVALGYKETGMVTMPAFVVDEVGRGKRGAGLELEIRGRAADLRGPLRAPKTRSFDVATLGELASMLAGDNGLTAAVDRALAPSPIGHIDQVDESDLHLLTRKALEAGGAVKVANGKWIIAKPGAEPVKAPGTGRSLGRVAVREQEVLSDAGWWITSKDRDTASAVVATTHDLDTGEQVDVTVAGGGAPDGPVTRLRETYPTQAAARAAAQGAAAKAARGKEDFDLTIVGRPEIKAGQILVASGFGEDDGDWTIRSVTHSLDASGLRTAIQAETPGG